MEETAASVLTPAAVTVASSVFKVIDVSSGIRLFSIRIELNCEILQKYKKEASEVNQMWEILRKEAGTRTLNVRTGPSH